MDSLAVKDPAEGAQAVAVVAGAHVPAVLRKPRQRQPLHERGPTCMCVLVARLPCMCVLVARHSHAELGCGWGGGGVGSLPCARAAGLTLPRNC